MSQSVCPFNIKFARELADDSPFAAREALAGKDARTLARELLGMPQDEFSAAFRGSPMKRAKLPGLKRNAAVVLGNVGTVEDVPVLEQALDDPEPLVREHAAWALGRLCSGVGSGPLRRRAARPGERRLGARPSQPVRAAMPPCAARHRCGVSPVHRRKARKKAAGSA
jgi:epoxyqueuosine reductase